MTNGNVTNEQTSGFNCKLDKGEWFTFIQKNEKIFLFGQWLKMNQYDCKNKKFKSKCKSKYKF